ncbi:SEP domain-containing protein, partial [Mycena polygramma]
LTFWRQGFTVEGGPLMRYDDPQHADVLAAIHSGRHAPPSIPNVRPGQRVDVQVTKRTEEDWVPPKAKPFSGAGDRLGAPLVVERGSRKCKTSVQVRLADGTRCVFFLS